MGARGPTDFGDYQIAHMPPAAVCAGAARWAAKYKEYALLRSVFCRTACQHAADKPAHRRAVRGSGSGSYRRVPEPVIARHPRGAWERQRGWDAEAIPCGPFCGVVTGEQREIQRPWVFGGVFAPFCRRGQKGVAPEREISLPLEEKRTGRRGRRPLRTHPSGCSGKRGAGDFRAYGGQACA